MTPEIPDFWKNLPKGVGKGPKIWYSYICWEFADLAQLAEHVTSNDEVGGSNPLVSIIKTYKVY